MEFKKIVKIIAVLAVFTAVVTGCKQEEPIIQETQAPVAETEVLQSPEPSDDVLLPNSVETAKENEPKAEVPEGARAGFVLLSDVVPEAILEIRYYSTYNFVGERIDGYKEPVALATREAAEALKKVSDELMQQGYRIKVFDMYRPTTAVNHFVRWSRDFSDVRMKEYFYPELDKSVLFNQGYISKKSGHSRGSTVDLTLFDMKSGKEVDMGAPFDFFGDISHPSSKKVTDEQYNNRMILKNAMEKHGFRSMSTEWWHFTLNNEPYADTYFSFDVCESSVK